MFRLAQDDCPAAQGAPSRLVQSGLGVHLRLRGLQPGTPAQPVDTGGVSQGQSVSAECKKASAANGTKLERTLSPLSRRPRRHRAHANQTFFSILLGREVRG